MTAEMDDFREFRTADLPRISRAEPVIRLLNLAVIFDLLFEDTEIITDPVSVSGKLEGRHGIEETCGKTSETAVSESGIHLLFAQFVNIEPEFLHRLFRGIHDFKIDHGVAERAPDQELQ